MLPFDQICADLHNVFVNEKCKFQVGEFQCLRAVATLTVPHMLRSVKVQMPTVAVNNQLDATLRDAIMTKWQQRFPLIESKWRSIAWKLTREEKELYRIIRARLGKLKIAGTQLEFSTAHVVDWHGEKCHRDRQHSSTRHHRHLSLDVRSWAFLSFSTSLFTLFSSRSSRLRKHFNFSTLTRVHTLDREPKLSTQSPFAALFRETLSFLYFSIAHTRRKARWQEIDTHATKIWTVNGWKGKK